MEFNRMFTTLVQLYLFVALVVVPAIYAVAYLSQVYREWREDDPNKEEEDGSQ